ncbi:MAG: family 78 glycoside hydrolase catalytic domain [Candidatus Hydrogenedentes bacterium]|nr:family 78 glycoside hydrolase catalytic domain [Candidatus Hydrogenedentota bacterium]
MSRKTVLRLIALLAVVGSSLVASAAITVGDLKCEYRREPLGIDTVRPRLSWKLQSKRRGAAQTAHHVIVASDAKLLDEGTGDLWDSGKRDSDRSVLVPYEGKPLTSRQQYWWKVRVWDELGEASEWSAPQRWSMGILRSEEWTAQWIGDDSSPVRKGLNGAHWLWYPEGNPAEGAPLGARYFRFALDVPTDKHIDSARTLIAADNSASVFVNGTPAGINPDYHIAGEFDIGELLKPGRNVVAVKAENGGESDNPAGLIGVVEVTFSDGSMLRSATDASWRVAKEDAANWTAPEFDDSAWAPAMELGPHGIKPWGDVSIPEDRRLAARMLRRTVELNKPVRSALVYMAGLGLSELYVNGRRIGDHVLSPALSDYTKRVYYVTYDVTPELRPGANAIGVQLGNGRYYAPRGSSFVGMLSYGYPKLLLQLHVEFEDGTSQVVVSDAQWKLSTDSPIRTNNEFDGEEYDARMETPGWSEPAFDDSTWRPATVVPAPEGVLASQSIEPIRVVETVTPKSVRRVKPGVYLVDMGQNMVGWCRVRLNGPAGTKVRMRHAETLKDDGSLYVANLRSAKAEYVHTLKGSGDEFCEPHFTYFGFRYVEMRGVPGELSPDMIEGKVVHDDVEPAGTFACSNETINAIYRNAVWGIRGNYRSVPTDCPQRDERQGWLGDRSEESRGEMYLYDLALFYEKWVQDMEDAQKDTGSVPDVAPPYYPFYTDNVTWPSSFIIIPGTLYEKYGDMRVIEKHYPAMKRWVDYMCQFIKDDLMPRDQYGDWCVPPESQDLIHSKDPKRKTSGDLIGSAYFYHDLTLMARYASLLGKAGDAERFSGLAGKMKSAFNRTYLNEQSGTYDNGTQTSCVLPLAFGIVPEARRAAVFDHLTKKIAVENNGHIGTGLIGGQWLMRTLASNGRSDIGYTLATQRDYPSWGYMIDHGATTIWELWNGNTADPAMNSHNHVMLLGDLLVWFYEYLAGIRPDPEAPGFKHFILRPEPVDGLDFARATYRSPYGVIESEWKHDGDEFTWSLSVPPNSTSDVYVPTSDAGSVSETDGAENDAQRLEPLRKEADRVVYRVGSGTYRFSSVKS